MGKKKSLYFQFWNLVFGSSLTTHTLPHQLSSSQKACQLDPQLAPQLITRHSLISQNVFQQNLSWFPWKALLTSILDQNNLQSPFFVTSIRYYWPLFLFLTLVYLFGLFSFPLYFFYSITFNCGFWKILFLVLLSTQPNPGWPHSLPKSSPFRPATKHREHTFIIGLPPPAVPLFCNCPYLCLCTSANGNPTDQSF